MEVRMCAYGYKWCKPTAIWTNLYPTWWTPRDPKEWCVACREGVMHEMFVVRRGTDDLRQPAQLLGFTQHASVNRLAPDLAEELARAMVRRHRDVREEQRQRQGQGQRGEQP